MPPAFSKHPKVTQRAIPCAGTSPRVEPSAASFFGDRMTYTMARPEGSPDTISRIEKDGKTTIDSNGYPENNVKVQAFKQPNHWQELPESLRVKSGHGGSHVFLVHEFLSAIAGTATRRDIWEAIACTLPGIVAHQSALKSGEPMKIRDYGVAPGRASRLCDRFIVLSTSLKYVDHLFAVLLCREARRGSHILQ
jgi:hypothetical protein